MESSKGFTTDMIIQYSIVGVILLAVCAWIIWKLFRKRSKEESGSCCGCGLAETCKRKKSYGNN